MSKYDKDVAEKKIAELEVDLAWLEIQAQAYREMISRLKKIVIIN